MSAAEPYPGDVLESVQSIARFYAFDKRAAVSDAEELSERLDVFTCPPPEIVIELPLCPLAVLSP